MYGKKLEYQKHLDAIKKHSWNLYWVPEELVLCQLGGSKSNSKHYEIRN